MLYQNQVIGYISLNGIMSILRQKTQQNFGYIFIRLCDSTLVSVY